MNVRKKKCDKYTISLSSRDIERLIIENIEKLLPAGVKLTSPNSGNWKWRGLSNERGSKFSLDIIFNEDGEEREIATVCECGKVPIFDGTWYKCECGKSFG